MEEIKDILQYIETLDISNKAYFLDFVHVCTEVFRVYQNLFSGEEIKMIHNLFYECGLNATKLVARLLSRKGPWFRQDRLNYEDILIDEAIENLSAIGLVRSQARTAEDALDLLKLLPLEHVQKLAVKYLPGISRQATRTESLALLKSVMGQVLIRDGAKNNEIYIYQKYHSSIVSICNELVIFCLFISNFSRKELLVYHYFGISHRAHTN